ncbi:hypothetical protein ACS4XI_25400, partial [Escherichia coli]|uniref:hypothetical protein n=1 Tax=Escherichia coli TaxID=562 RepID=UPI003F42F8F0
SIEALVHKGDRVDAIRYALQANAAHGKRREAGDYIKGFTIAVKCGLCEPHDTAAVQALLVCSQRWARDLTAPARAKEGQAREARI